MSYAGCLFVLVGPSGAGKNAIINTLLGEQNPGNLRQLTTMTTRPRRETEQEGREHFFVSHARFQELIDEGALIEYQIIHKEHYYGTPHGRLEMALTNGETLVADIDMYGARALKNAFPQNVMLVFIAPPNTALLEQRIRERSSDTEAQIQTRLQRAALEMTYVPECDYLVINDDLAHATALVKEIILAQRSGQPITDALSVCAWISGAAGVLVEDEHLPCMTIQKRESAVETLTRYLQDTLHIIAEAENAGVVWYHHAENRPTVELIVPMRTLQYPSFAEWQPPEEIALPMYLKEMLGDLKPTFG